jgi:hypothetical protein
MKVYKLGAPTLYVIYAILLILTGIVLLVTVKSFQDRLTPVPWFFALLLGVMLLVWNFYLRIPFAITRGDDNVLTFKSVLRRTRVAPSDIVSIKAMPLTLGFIKLKHRGGTLRLICQITGLYELIYTVQSLNPAVEIKGC